jgi:hypothetical protein
MPNTYTELDKITVGTAVSTVTFSSIPGTYTDLVVVIAAAGSSYVNSAIRFNGDTATNYSATRLYGNGSAASSARYNTETFSYINDLTTSIVTTVLNIQNYANTTTYKTFLSRDSAAAGGLGAWVGLWRKTPIAAISSIDLIALSGANFIVGSTFSLYGIAAAPAWAAKATGGTITNDVQYTYHTFTSSGTFTPSQALSVDYLVVAGGGGGGGNISGGGGAGGFRTNVGGSPFSVTTTPISVTVGAGGSKGTGGNADATSGVDSVFSTITSTGGGRGASENAGAPVATGGSGGGGGWYSKTGAAGNTPSTSPSQGNSGGNAEATTFAASGGGGGAGSAGTNGSLTANVGGNGGAGTASSISGSSVTYAGGGGGGRSRAGTTSGAPGGAGGGQGGYDAGSPNTGTQGQDASANLGGGGGGAAWGSAQNGGNGGSGIVIIRYEN